MHHGESEAPPTTNREAVALHDMSTDRLVTGYKELARRYHQLPGDLAEIAAELHRRDADRYTWRNLAELGAFTHPRVWRWVQRYTGQDIEGES